MPTMHHMHRSKILSLALLMLAVGLIGCQGQEPEQASAEQPSVAAEKPSTPTASSEPSASSSVIKPGMDMAEVKKLKGVPKETKHEHGAGGAELDIWIYEDQTVTFSNGKIAE